MVETNNLNDSIKFRSKENLSPTDLLRYALMMDDEVARNAYYGDVEISGNRKDLIKEALIAGADPNVGVDAGTALDWAENAEEMKLLIEAGADVNIKGMNYRTALMGVGKEKAKLLLAHGADVDAKDVEGKTALMYACESGDIEKVKVLIEAGADYNAKDNEGKTVINYARTPESKGGFLKALSTCNWGKCKTTALGLAVIKDDVKEAQKLLAMGVDVNAFDSCDYSALMYAKTEKMANLLVENGADVNAENKWGKTALQRACEYDECTGVVKALLEAEAHVDAIAVNNACENYNIETLKLLVNVGGYDATKALRQARTAEMVKICLRAGADVNAKDNVGRTSLMHACTLQNAKARETIKELIKNETLDGVNAKDNDGRTALMYACMHNSHDVDVLVYAGADVNAKDNDGKTALMYASDDNVLEFLIKSGADVFAKDKKGKKASDYHPCSKIIQEAEKAQFLADKRHKLAEKIGLGDVKLPETVKKAESKVSKVVKNIYDNIRS